MSERPAKANAAAPNRSRTLAGALAVVVLGGVVVTLLVTRKPPTTNDDRPAAPTPTKSAAASRVFSFLLDSTPSGAEVFEGDKRIGATPLQLSIDEESLHTGPRTFVIRSAGYLPYTVVQGRSDVTVKTVVPLVAAPDATGLSAPSTELAKKPWSKPPAIASVKPSVTPPTDIQLKR